MLGVAAGTVRVEPYNDEWRRLFEQERARIQAALGGWVLDIQHIGSTAVPGLAAKPLIDLGVAVASFEESARCIAPLEELGYRYLGENGIPRRHFFVRGEPRTHNLHMNEIHSRDWIQTILFRDYLLAHPPVAAAYGALKRRLAREHANDFPAYHAGKHAFISQVLELAHAEREGAEA